MRKTIQNKLDCEFPQTFEVYDEFEGLEDYLDIQMNGDDADISIGGEVYGIYYKGVTILNPKIYSPDIIIFKDKGNYMVEIWTTTQGNRYLDPPETSEHYLSPSNTLDEAVTKIIEYEKQNRNQP